MTQATKTNCKGLHAHTPCEHTFRGLPNCWYTCSICADEWRERAAARQTANRVTAAVRRQTNSRQPIGICVDCGERNVYERVGTFGELICSRCR